MIASFTLKCCRICKVLHDSRELSNDQTCGSCTKQPAWAIEEAQAERAAIIAPVVEPDEVICERCGDTGYGYRTIDGTPDYERVECDCGCGN